MRNRMLWLGEDNLYKQKQSALAGAQHVRNKYFSFNSWTLNIGLQLGLSFQVSVETGRDRKYECKLYLVTYFISIIWKTKPPFSNATISCPNLEIYVHPKIRPNIVLCNIQFQANRKHDYNHRKLIGSRKYIQCGSKYAMYPFYIFHWFPQNLI